MAANKFATMLHRNTNRITLTLVYAILEWILILLLLLNSFFSYLIVKYADYFGLKRPCLWCSRLDHIFEPPNFHNSCTSLLCETHASEISKLGYCHNHRKLAESRDMCEDCSSSSHSQPSNKFAFFPWVTQLGVLQDYTADKGTQNGAAELKCSCCGVGLGTKLHFHDYYLIKPSWEDSDYTHKGNFVLEAQIDGKIGEDDHSNWSRSAFLSDHCEEKQGIYENRGTQVENEEDETERNYSCSVPNFDFKKVVPDDHENEDFHVELEQQAVRKNDLNVSINAKSYDQPRMAQVGCSKDLRGEIRPQHLEFYIDQNDCHLIPIELMESGATEKYIRNSCGKAGQDNCGNEDFVLEFDENIGTQYELVEDKRNLEEDVPLLSAHDSEEESKVVVLESSNIVEGESFHEMHEDYDVVKEEFEQVANDQTTSTPTIDGNDVRKSLMTAEEEVELDKKQLCENVLQMESDEIEADVSIGTEIPDHEPIDDIQTKEVPPYQCMQDLSTSNANYHEYENHGLHQADENGVEFRTITIETREPVVNNHLSQCSECNEVEEDKIPDTPTSVDSLHHLHKKLLLLERRESGAEESLDGSVISDIDAGDGVLTVEKLKSVLRLERKALNALYAELEEERSASAVAASQTMAMINRLQEEKAAMQMEALQYQRMMEEQTEYDQEALQLLNELMVKREKEKVELEKELVVLRKKVQDYQAKEQILMMKRKKDVSMRSRNSSASCSNSEDSDGLSIDLNHEGKEEDGFENRQESINQNTPTDAVLYLEESLSNFEEERLSILEQLKVLEEKLVILSDEEEQHFEDIRTIELLHEENGNGCNDNFDYSSDGNGVTNGHYKKVNGKHNQEIKNIATKAKRLLPLFDATDVETEDGVPNGHAEGFDSVASLKLINGGKKLAIEEEVDNVYERLQALEADREFLRHCITSLSKGDKGLELLQEILLHLRDLRSVELRVRNMGDGAL